MTSVGHFPPPHLIEEDGPKTERPNGATTKNSDSSTPLALPAPSDDEITTTKLAATQEEDVDESAVRFDHLGPLVVNTNGTLSRIHNWGALSEGEKQTTLRVLVKRNKSRLEAIKAKECQGEGQGATGEMPSI